MKVNPLFILLLLVIIFGLVLYKNVTMEKKMAGAASYIKQVEKKAITISSMKNSWQNPKISQQKVQSILRHPFLGKAEVTQEVRQGRLIATVKKANKQALDTLCNKILNETLTIKKFTILRQSDQMADVELEIIL